MTASSFWYRRLDVAELRLRLGIGADRVLLVRVPPEDVRLEVAAGEIEEEQAVVVVVDRLVEERQPLVQHHARLPGEFIVGEDAVGPGLVVFLKARGVERAQLGRHVLDERLGLRHPLRGGARVHVDRRDVEPEVGRDLLEEEPADAAGRSATARARASRARNRASSSGSTGRA